MNPNSKKLSFLGSAGWKQKIEVLPGLIQSEGSEGICVSCLCLLLVEASSPWFMLSISVLSLQARSSLRLSFSSWELKCPQCLSANIWMLSCQAVGTGGILEGLGLVERIYILMGVVEGIIGNFRLFLFACSPIIMRWTGHLCHVPSLWHTMLMLP